MKKKLLYMTFLAVSYNAVAQDRVVSSTTQHITQPEHISAMGGNGYMGEDCSMSLTTTYNSNNGNDGVMFEITALDPIYVTGFTASINGSGYIKIYRKSGSYIGFETDPTDWIMVDSVSVAANGVGTFIPVETGPLMVAGETQSFYITGNGSGADLNYTDGTTEGAIYASNAELVIKEGKGITYPFGTSYTPRVFNGTVHYCKQLPMLCDTIGTQFNAENGNAGIMFDVTATANQVNINQFFIDFTDGFVKGKVRVYTRPGTHVGFESNITGWSLIDSNEVVFPLANSFESVGFPIDVSIDPGQTQAFYIYVDGAGIDYSNGAGLVGDVFKQDANINIKSGTGSGGLFSSSINTPRNFNGNIQYCVSLAGNESITESLVQIYPNPANDFIRIQSNVMVDEIQIIDISGRVVLTNIIHSTDALLSIQTLPSGVYQAKIISGNEFRIEKLIIE